MDTLFTLVQISTAIILLVIILEWGRRYLRYRKQQARILERVKQLEMENLHLRKVLQKNGIDYDE